MSECTKGEVGCECIPSTQTTEEICVCSDAYIPRDGVCQSAGCYDPLTDTFCGNYPGGTCDNTKHECVCNLPYLESVNGRCIADNCITEVATDGQKIECWGRGHCVLDFGGGNCVCFSAYFNRARCISCNPLVAIEKKTTTFIPDCIPLACLDPENPDPDVICNGYGTCDPHIQSNFSTSYACTCDDNSLKVEKSCYPLECVVASLSGAEQYSVCNGYGNCDVASKTCVCNHPYTGIFCRSCLPGFIGYYTIAHSTVSFECVSHACFNSQTNAFCAGHGSCVLDPTTKTYKCVCNEGATLSSSSSTFCVPTQSLRRGAKRQLLLGTTVLIVLLTMAIVGCVLYFLAEFVILKKKDRQQVAYVRKCKTEIARNLHKEVKQDSEVLSSRSILSTTDYINFQRRYM